MSNFGTDYRLPNVNTNLPSRTVEVTFEPSNVTYQLSPDPRYQTITYTLPRPYVGQEVDVTYQQTIYKYIISDVILNGNFVESFFIRQGTEIPIQVIIRNGTWAINLPNSLPQTFYFYP